MTDTQLLDGLTEIKELLSELRGMIASKGAVISSIVDVPLPEEDIEPSGLDEFVSDEALVEQYMEYGLHTLRSRALNHFDEESVKASWDDKEKLRRNVYKAETGKEFPRSNAAIVREKLDNKILHERDLGFGNLEQLRTFATKVRGMDLSAIQKLEQEELYQLLISKKELYTEKELEATPKSRLLNIAKSLNIQSVPEDKPDIIKAIMSKQES